MTKLNLLHEYRRFIIKSAYFPSYFLKKKEEEFFAMLPKILELASTFSQVQCGNVDCPRSSKIYLIRGIGSAPGIKQILLSDPSLFFTSTGEIHSLSAGSNILGVMGVLLQLFFYCFMESSKDSV